MAAVAGLRIPAQLLIFIGIVLGITVEPFILIAVGALGVGLLWRG
jgi:hypothetical protein